MACGNGSSVWWSLLIRHALRCSDSGLYAECRHTYLSDLHVLVLPRSKPLSLCCDSVMT